MKLWWAIIGKIEAKNLLRSLGLTAFVAVWIVGLIALIG